jgi:hypothetical protein
MEGEHRQEWTLPFHPAKSADPMDRYQIARLRSVVDGFWQCQNPQHGAPMHSSGSDMSGRRPLIKGYFAVVR